MIIHLSPVRGDTRGTVVRSGDTLILDGAAFDFGALAEGEFVPHEALDSPWFAGPVTRQDGRIVVTLRLAHGADAPVETRFPAPVVLDTDGPVPLPPYRAPGAGAGGAPV